MQTWNLNEVPAPEGSRSPVVLETADAARAVLIALDRGQALGDHRVKERAWVVVVAGRARIEAGGEVVDAGVGSLTTFAPDETHSVAATDGPVRILLFLSPWPGEGHYRGEELSLG